ncbi:hypothetical protein PV328_010677 [Microctonus aethiopoides]|uniref:Uncharacterized protein n=1 Tax=Microctonus aethiopoides TaxID=144406 RepID=A0AA39FI85_9HYME|nr:hypothetical protein PV328_010677 [Microctonus aethiopoides]
MGLICFAYCFAVALIGYKNNFCQQLEKSEPGYEWVKFEPQIVNDTRLILLREIGNVRRVVGRKQMNKNKNLIPIQLVISLEGILLERDMLGDVIEVDVLINKSGKISWTLTNNSVPKNAIEGGKLNENKKIYICRVKDGSDNVGWIKLDDHLCNVHPFFEHTKYDILTHDE